MYKIAEKPVRNYLFSLFIFFDMQCPRCQSIKNSVVDSRVTDHSRAIRRRRECDECEYRFTTFERLRTADLIVVKKDKTREAYDRDKLERGVWKACEKRPISQPIVDEMISELEEAWVRSKEVQSIQIGEEVMEKLKDIDLVAYIRFASVYNQFADIESFHQAIIGLGQEAREQREKTVKVN